MYLRVRTLLGVREIELIRPGIGWRVRANGEQWVEEILGDQLDVELVSYHPRDVIAELELCAGVLKPKAKPKTTD